MRTFLLLCFFVIFFSPEKLFVQDDPIWATANSPLNYNPAAPPKGSAYDLGLALRHQPDTVLYKGWDGMLSGNWLSRGCSPVPALTSGIAALAPNKRLGLILEAGSLSFNRPLAGPGRPVPLPPDRL